ncbi:hypothetical protein SAMN04487890_108130 [Mucilaginibacter polytrichastri]|nr:hypothetical protein SAMN04487890_108130 [Mucilaginibacter polytrichastri]
MRQAAKGLSNIYVVFTTPHGKDAENNTRCQGGLSKSKRHIPSHSLFSAKQVQYCYFPYQNVIPNVFQDPKDRSQILFTSDLVYGMLK